MLENVEIKLLLSKRYQIYIIDKHTCHKIKKNMFDHFPLK